MNKQKFIEFINRYSLGGSVESIAISLNNQVLSTDFMTGDKNLLGKVSAKNFEGFVDEEEVKFGLSTTGTLLRYLGVVGEEIQLSLEKIDAGDMPKYSSLYINDENTEVNVVLTDLSVVPKTPPLKNRPEMELEIDLNDDFIDRFIKAKGVMKADSFVIQKNSNSDTIEVILGYSRINTDRFTIHVDGECDGEFKPIAFNADYLREIFVANKNSDEKTMVVSSKGLSHLTFRSENFDSEYYLIQVNIDD